MSTHTEFQPPTRNPFGAVDDILMWFTHRYNLHIELDVQGCDVRHIQLPAGRITILPPGDVITFVWRKTGQEPVQIHSKTRLEFLDALEKLVK